MNSLSTREKTIVVAGTAVIFVFLIAQFVFFPLMDRKKELMRILAIEQDGIQQMTALRNQYLGLTRDMGGQKGIMADRSPEFTLFSFLDSRAEASGIKKNIDYMRPFTQTAEDGSFQISKVRLKLKNLYLNNFMEFLKQVETSGNGVHVISISLARTGENDNLLEAVLETQTLMPGEAP
jgi:type II secretory pathway component PulM